VNYNCMDKTTNWPCEGTEDLSLKCLLLEILDILEEDKRVNSF